MILNFSPFSVPLKVNNKSIIVEVKTGCQLSVTGSSNLLIEITNKPVLYQCTGTQSMVGSFPEQKKKHFTVVI